MGEMGKGELQGPDLEKTTFNDLVKIIEDEYRMNERRSVPRMKTALNFLRAHLGMLHARDITLDRLNRYVAHRLDAKAAPASIRYEISILRRAFRLAQRAGKAICPPFPSLQVHNVRQGFFEREDFQAVKKHLPEYLRRPMTFAYLTGWRTPSEILTLEWKQVDFSAGTVRLEPGTTKNDEGRVFPFAVLPELAELLREQWARTMDYQFTAGQAVRWVFHRKGRPIKDFRKAWKVACKAAGVPERIPP